MAYAYKISGKDLKIDPDHHLYKYDKWDDNNNLQDLTEKSEYTDEKYDASTFVLVYATEEDARSIWGNDNSDIKELKEETFANDEEITDVLFCRGSKATDEQYIVIPKRCFYQSGVKNIYYQKNSSGQYPILGTLWEEAFAKCPIENVFYRSDQIHTVRFYHHTFADSKGKNTFQTLCIHIPDAPVYFGSKVIHVTQANILEMNHIYINAKKINVPTNSNGSVFNACIHFNDNHATSLTKLTLLVKENSFQEVTDQILYYPLIRYIDVIKTFQCNMFVTPRIEQGSWRGNDDQSLPQINLCILDVTEEGSNLNIQQLNYKLSYPFDRRPRTIQIDRLQFKASENNYKIWFAGSLGISTDILAIELEQPTDWLDESKFTIKSSVTQLTDNEFSIREIGHDQDYVFTDNENRVDMILSIKEIDNLKGLAQKTKDCVNFRWAKFDVTITGGEGNNSLVFEHSLFKDFYKIGSITVLNDVILKEIEDQAFCEALGLEKFIAPRIDEDLTIGFEAFKNCYDLTTLQIGQSYKDNNNNTINSITAKTIKNSSFENCHSLTSLYLDSSITSIGYSAFAKLYVLEKLFWNALIDGQTHTDFGEYQIGYFQELGKYQNCTVYICNDVKILAPFVFSDFFSGLIEKAKLQLAPRIGAVHACYCNRTNHLLTTVEASQYSQLTAIGESAFKGVNRHNPRGVDADNWDALSWLTQFPNLRIIHKDAFRGASAITSLTLPPKLEIIEQQAFDNQLQDNDDVGELMISKINSSFPATLKFVSSLMFGELTSYWGIEQSTQELFLRAKDRTFDAFSNKDGEDARLASIYPHVLLRDSNGGYWYLGSRGYNNLEQHELTFTVVSRPDPNKPDLVIDHDSFNWGLYHRIKGFSENVLKNTRIQFLYNSTFPLPRAIQAIQDRALVAFLIMAPTENGSWNGEPIKFDFNCTYGLDLIDLKAIQRSSTIALGAEALCLRDLKNTPKDSNKYHYLHVPKIVEMCLTSFRLQKDSVLLFDDEEGLNSWVAGENMSYTSHVFDGNYNALITDENYFKCRQGGWQLRYGSTVDDSENITGVSIGQMSFASYAHTFLPDSGQQLVINPGCFAGLDLDELYIDLTACVLPTRNETIDFFKNKNNLIIYGNYDTPANSEQSQYNLTTLKIINGYENTVKTQIGPHIEDYCLFGTGIVSKLTTLNLPIYAYDNWWRTEEKCSALEKLSSIQQFLLYGDPNNTDITNVLNTYHLRYSNKDGNKKMNSGFAVNNKTLTVLQIPFLHTENKVVTLRKSKALNFYQLDNKDPQSDFQQLEQIILTHTFNLPADCFVALQKCHTIDLGESAMKEIGARAFSGCEALKQLRLPTTLKRIGENAFDQCKNLTAVYYYGEDATLNKWYNIDFKNLIASPFNAVVVTEELSPSLYLNTDKSPQVIKSFEIPDKEHFFTAQTIGYDPIPFYNYPITELVFSKPYSYTFCKHWVTSTQRGFSIMDGSKPQILRFKQLHSDYPIDGNFFHIFMPGTTQKGSAIGTNYTVELTNLKYIIYDPDDASNITIPKNCFKKLAPYKDIEQGIICIPDNITFIEEHAFYKCNYLIRQLDISKQLISANNVVALDAYKPLTFYNLIKSNNSGLITSNPKNYVKVTNNGLCFYDSGSEGTLNFLIGSTDPVDTATVSSIDLASPTKFSVITQTANGDKIDRGELNYKLRAVDLLSIKMNPGKDDQLNELIIPWFGTCNDFEQTTKATCCLIDWFNMTNNGILYIDKLTITNTELMDRFHTVAPLFDRIHIKNLQITAKCIFGDTATDELPPFISESSLFDKTQTTMESIQLHMEIVPINLLNANNSMQSITSELLITPYSQETNHITLKSYSLVCKKINNISFNIGNSDDITSIHFAKNAFYQQLANNYIYYTGSLADWGQYNTFETSGTSNILSATKKLYTKCVFGAISSKEFETQLTPTMADPQTVETLGGSSTTYYSYLINDYAFEGNNQINSVNCTPDYGSEAKPQNIIVRIIPSAEYDKNEKAQASKNPFGGSNTLIEMFSGEQSIEIGEVDIREKAEYFKVSTYSSEQIIQDATIKREVVTTI